MVLQRLGYFGFDSSYPIVQKGAEYLFSKQQEDGAWPIPGKKDLTDEEYGYQMMPIQTAIPLLGLVMCGYSNDKRSENAFEWLLQQCLKDGAWPVGLSAGNYGRVAGCRSNTTAVLSCFAYHPKLSEIIFCLSFAISFEMSKYIRSFNFIIFFLNVQLLSLFHHFSI